MGGMVCCAERRKKERYNPSEGDKEGGDMAVMKTKADLANMSVYRAGRKSPSEVADPENLEIFGNPARLHSK